MTSLKWPLRSLAVAAVIGLAARADAQQIQPGLRPAQPKIDPPKADPKADPKAKPAEQPKNPIVVQPRINTLPGIPAWQLNQPVFNPGPFYNPALNNPWMNQTRVVPYNPFLTQPINNPLFWPQPNPFVNNPFALIPNNPFAPNPFLVNPFNNPFISPFNNPFNTLYGPGTSYSYTPPIAIQQPGQFFYRGPDLLVNPTSGTVYKPLTGVAQTADGSVFYRVPGTGLPTATGVYSPGSGLYFNPDAGTFLNPKTGVISKPGVTTVFTPWIR
jgi:hypothetical protein